MPSASWASMRPNITKKDETRLHDASRHSLVEVDNFGKTSPVYATAKVS